MLLATADGDAGLVVVMRLLQTLVVMVRLEMMRLLGVKSEVMPVVAEQRHLDHGGPVKARLALQALALEGFHGAVRSPLRSAHLRGARPFICRLHLSLHPCQVGSGLVCQCDRRAITAGIRSVTFLSGSVSLIHTV